MVKQAGVVAWLGGIAALVVLTIWCGLDAVGHAIASVGWGILLVVMVRAVTVSVAGAGWWLLFPSKVRPQFGACLLLRFVREAVNVLLPVAQVGGDVVGARLLTGYAVPGALAAASVIVDILIQAAAQFLFAALGLLTLMALGADHALARSAAIGLAVAALLLAGFYLAQRRGGQRVLQSIVFAFMGHPVSIGEALVIESLLHAVRGAAFAIPGALGAQEGALVVLCAAFGIPPEQAIALSLVKRAADVVLGMPGLLGWQMLEWGRLLPSYRRQPAREPVNPRS